MTQRRTGMAGGRLRGHIRSFLRVASLGRPPRVLLFGALSLGDDLLCTTVLREARRRGTPFAMMTARPELFRNNPDVSAILPVDDYYAQALRRLGSRVVQPYYVRRADADPAKDLLPPHHILAEMCRLAGLRGAVTLRPYLQLEPGEIVAGRRFERQIAIQSTCLTARIPYPTKDWGAARFAEVARQLQPDFQLVQIGDKEDPPLPVHLDLRGRTTLRESAGILAGSVVFLGVEGFLTHLARAVDCPAVVVHGGRAPEGIFSYPANRNLFTSPPCSPCGLRTGCPHDFACLRSIPVEVVVAAVRQLAASTPSRPLAADTLVLP